MAYITLSPSSVDVQSPIDDLLMGRIKDNEDDLDSRVVSAANSPFVLSAIGRVSALRGFKRGIDYAILTKEFTPSLCRFLLKKSGTSALGFDIRKHTTPNSPITEIAHQYSASTSSIAKTGSSLSTQSISRATAQISTQTITHAKAALNIQSIIGLGGNLWQFNVNTAIDSDTVVGDSIVTSGTTSGGNSGTFVIVEIGRGGGNNFVVSNASGVAQTSATGSAQIKIMSYNFTNPVSTEFAAGEAALFASHTSGANNGTLTIFAVNASGNNIWVKNASGVTQGSASGSADCNRWIYSQSSAVSTTDYIVGEKILAASHSSGGNNGNFRITAVNSGGNNVVVYNSAGAVQGGVAGTVNTNRWTYTQPSDPSAQVSAGDTVYFSGHTNALNDGVFTIKEVNRPATNNLVVYNESGVAQGGSAGTAESTRKLVKFATDLSATYTTDSYIEMLGVVSSLYNYADGRAPFKVLQVNRGGGANYNVVIDNPRAPSQASPAGFVQIEMKSIFTAAPSLAASVTGNSANQFTKGSSAAMVSGVIPANTPLMLYLTSVPTGDPRDLMVSLQ